MNRIYLSLVHEHLLDHRQMLLLAGPRQVGKTTLSLSTKNFTDNFFYFNWDTQEHRQLIVKGPITFAEQLNLQQLRKILRLRRGIETVANLCIERDGPDRVTLMQQQIAECRGQLTGIVVFADRPAGVAHAA